MTFPPSNQLAHQQDEQKAQPGKAFITRGSNPPMFGSTEVPRISTIETVQPINYNSVKKSSATTRRLKSLYLGDKLRICHLQKDDAHHPVIGQIQVTLFLNGRQLLSQNFMSSTMWLIKLFLEEIFCSQMV